jgi:hypothetical protein
MVRNQREIQPVVPQQLIEPAGLGLRPFAGGGFGGVERAVGEFLLGLGQFGDLFDDAAQGFGGVEVALAAETLAGRQLVLLFLVAGFDHTNIFIFQQ